MIRRMSLLDAVGPHGFITDGDWVETKDQDPNGDIRLIQLADIGDGVYLNKSDRHLTRDTFRRLKCTQLREGDILVSRMADPLARACIFPGDAKPCATVVDACIIRSDESLANNNWLKYAINSPSFRQVANSMVAGATRQRISRGNLQSIELLVPPLSAQRKVVDVLSRAEGILRLHREAQVKSQAIIPALFVDLFGDPITNPKGWRVQPLGSLGSLDRGRSKHRPRDAAELYGGKYPFIQTGDVANSAGHITTYTATYSDAGLRQSKLWPKGTLCITIAANIAKTGVLGFDACFPDSVVGFLPGDNVTTAYVKGWLSFLQPTLEASAPQAAQKNINLAILRALPVPVPPKKTQIQFESRCEDVLALVRQQQAANAAAEASFAALLGQAFSHNASARRSAEESIIA